MAREHTVLFVDDDPRVLDVLVDLFGSVYEVMVARSGGDALEILERREVDVLVADLRMPKMTGIELIEKARALRPGISSIILTAHTERSDLIEAINRGQVYRYILKPCDYVDLGRTIEQALKEVRLRRENDSLLVETKRRLAAVEVLSEVARGSSSLSSYEEVVDRITSSLERLADVDVSAMLVTADPSNAAVLTLRCREPFDQKGLVGFKEKVLERYGEHGGVRIDQQDVLVRVIGSRVVEPPGSQPEELPSKLSTELFLYLGTAGEPLGLLALAARSEGVFTEDDDRVLKMLAEQAAEMIEAVRNKRSNERRLLGRVIEGMTDGVALLDGSGEVFVDNTAARRLLGASKAQPVTTSLLEEKLGSSLFDLVRRWERLGAKPHSEDAEVEGRFIRAVISPIMDSEGCLNGMSIVVRDVDDERRLTQQKEDFVSVISHELRTPLTAVTGSLDLLLSGFAGEVSGEHKRYLSLAKDSIEKLNDIVDDVLDIERLSTGALKIEPQVTSLDDLLSCALRRYEEPFRRKDITVEVEKTPAPARLLVDPDRLLQVVGNLLDNAVKFTPEGGRVEIEIFQAPSIGTTTGFSIWTSGKSIPPADLERIFERFERVQAPRGRRMGGTGLGLAISRSILEAHGGAIWADETVEEGARFVVALPLDGIEDLARSRNDTDGARSSSPRDEEHRGSRVLVVSADRSTAFALQGILLSAGFEAHWRGDPQGALALAREREPSVAVVDFAVPSRHGTRPIEALSHDPDTGGVPILAVSSSDQAERAKRAGADAFIARPLGSSRLLASLRSLIKADNRGQTVLVVDDDASARALCSETLNGLGFDVREACGAADWRAEMASRRPDLLILDLLLPDSGRDEVLDRLEADREAGSTSVILTSARKEGLEERRALRLGDDYLVKPFGSGELWSRVESVLARRELELAESPTTGLPGCMAIQRNVSLRINSQSPFSVCYLSLLEFESFRDGYGRAKAGRVVLETGDILREVLAKHGGPTDFIGHVAGDDFVFITAPERAKAVCRALIETIDRTAPLHYDGRAAHRTDLEAPPGPGEAGWCPPMRATVTAVTDRGGRFMELSEVAALTKDLKEKARRRGEQRLVMDEGQVHTL